MPRALIVNADDFGYDPAVSRGIAEAMRRGIVSSTTFMVNTPFSAEAAELAAGLAVGLHLNLARWPPCWPDFPRELLQGGELSEKDAAKLPPRVVAEEARAQLDRLAALLGRPATHVDVHKHLHLHANVLEGLIEVARERRVPVRSINPSMRAALSAAGIATNPAFIGDAGATAYWTVEQLEAQLRALPDGLTELMCHPGHRPSHTASGYSEQREVELATFLDPRARSLLDELGIRLVDFSAL